MQCHKWGPLLAALWLSSGAADADLADQIIRDCRNSEHVQVFCGVTAPEDLAAIPHTPYIVIGQFGEMGKSKGGIVLFDTRTQRFTTLLAPGHTPRASAGAVWGEPTCTRWDKKFFSPHGIDIVRRADGALALLVVNHGPRDSIEWFELRPDDRGVELLWRGCVGFPADAMLNDVTGLADGSLFATTMFDRTAPAQNGLNRTLRAAFESLSNSGYVFGWTPTTGLRKLAGTDSPAPNGIAAAPDGSAIYVNVYPAGEVRKISVASGATLATVKVTGPDNITWGDDGLLYAASHVPPFPGHTRSCLGAEQGACGHSFAIVAIAPDTLRIQNVFSHQGTPFGAATSALKLGDAVYLGSFVGNRIAKVPTSAFAAHSENGEQE